MFFSRNADPWLTEVQSSARRMESFHRERVELIPSEATTLPLPDKRILVVHLFPFAAAKDEVQFPGMELKKHARLLPALGGSTAQRRFNVDGYLIYSGGATLRSYTQLFRNGCVEAAMSDAAYAAGQGDSPLNLRDNYCEKVVFEFVGHYLKFCAGIGIAAPVRMYSAIVGCVGACIRTHWGDVSDHALDRSPAFLPPVDFADLGAETIPSLRPWCDALAQACGLEQSLNFDADGSWREGRR